MTLIPYAYSFQRETSWIHTGKPKSKQMYLQWGQRGK